MTENKRYDVKTHPATRFYDRAQTVFNPKTNAPRTNIFTSYTTSQPAYGTVFGFHGYAGSPVQGLMLSARDAALKNGFNFVAIESYNISAISHRRGGETIDTGTLRSFCDDVEVGVTTALGDRRINVGHKIAWAHCLGCQTVLHNYMLKPTGVNIFDEYVFCAPYFLPEKKLLREHFANNQSDKIISQNIFNLIFERVCTIFKRQDHRQQDLFRILENILRAIPQNMVSRRGVLDIDQYVDYIFRETTMRPRAAFAHKSSTLILAGNDILVENKTAAQFYERMPIPAQSTIMLRGEDHNMGRDKEKYRTAANIVMARAKKIIDIKNSLAQKLRTNTRI